MSNLINLSFRMQNLKTDQLTYFYSRRWYKQNIFRYFKIDFKFSYLRVRFAHNTPIGDGDRYKQVLIGQLKMKLMVGVFEIIKNLRKVT